MAENSEILVMSDLPAEQDLPVLASEETSGENEDDFMQMIYVSLGILGIAFILFILLFAFKNKLCPE